MNLIEFVYIISGDAPRIDAFPASNGTPAAYLEAPTMKPVPRLTCPSCGLKGRNLGRFTTLGEGATSLQALGEWKAGSEKSWAGTFDE